MAKNNVAEILLGMVRHNKKDGFPLNNSLYFCIWASKSQFDYFTLRLHYESEIEKKCEEAAKKIFFEMNEIGIKEYEIVNGERVREYKTGNRGLVRCHSGKMEKGMAKIFQEKLDYLINNPI
ncbi:MAG: hypothetical protein ABIG10_01115 [bacterium]